MSLAGTRASNSTLGGPSNLASTTGAMAMNTSSVPMSATGAQLNATSSGTASKTMAAAASAELRENTSTTVDCLFGLQIGSLALALLVASPLIWRHTKTGRYKKGWFITRNKSQSLANVDIVSNSVNRAPDIPIGRKPTDLAVRCRSFYNRYLLIPIPWVEFTVGRLFVLLVISSLVLFGIFFKNTADPFTNFKRPGWVSAAFLPLQFLLAMKNSPIGLIGKGYNNVNYIHRFLGWAILSSGSMHGFVWWKNHVYNKMPMVFKGAPLYGLIAVTALSMVALSSMRFIRSRVYQIFLTLHILGYVVALVALWKHIPVLKPIIYASTAFMVADYCLSYLKTSVRSAVFTSLPAGLTKIEIDRLGEGWKAGQHVYIRVFNGRQSFEKHPFTIVNAPASLSPSRRTSLVLVVKATGNFTTHIHRVGYSEAALIGGDLESIKGSVDEKNLHELSEAASDRRLAVAVEGPYGVSYMDMCDYETVMLVAGGSGFTYCMSTFEHIIGNAVKGIGYTKKIFVLWNLRDLEMVQVFASAMNTALAAAQQLRFEVFVRLYVTTPLKHSDINPIPTAQITPERVDFKAVLAEALQSTCWSIDSRGETQGCGVAVGVCGPNGLAVSARAAVSTANDSLARKAGGLYLHTEEFSC